MYFTKENWEEKDLAEKLWLLCEKSYAFGSPWTQRQFEEHIKENGCYLIYVNNSQIVGFIAYQKVLDEVDIEHVVMAEKVQGRGLGQQLMNTFKQKMSEEQIRKMFLEVRSSNEKAQHFYQKNGFEKIAVRKNYYQHPKEDGLVMCWEDKENK